MDVKVDVKVFIKLYVKLWMYRVFVFLLRRVMNTMLNNKRVI